MKKIRNLFLISLILIVALVTTIIFLTIPDGRTDTTAFWIAWSFAIPVNFVVALILHFWSGNKKAEGLIHMPLAYYLVIIFAPVYLVVGCIFMYLPIVKTLLLIIIELIISVAYIICILYFIFGANYISSVRKETKEKVNYIKMLVVDIQDCINKTSNPKLLSSLEAFQENVQYSDPMSHASLAGIEQQLVLTVADISSKIDQGLEEEVLALIKRGEMQLKSRNDRCIMLK